MDWWVSGIGVGYPSLHHLSESIVRSIVRSLFRCMDPLFSLDGSTCVEREILKVIDDLLCQLMTQSHSK